MKTRMLAILAASLAATPAVAQNRLPNVPSSQYTPEQKKAAEDFLAERKVPISGPFEVMMHSPHVMSLARGMGDYLRFKSGIGNTLSELAILVTARAWSQDYEWFAHAPIAAKAGIKPEIIDAIRNGQHPVGMSDDEDIVYEFSTELQRDKRFSDATFARAERRFGKPAVVDMIGINGYYTFLAMQLNSARFPLPDGGTRLPRFPE